MTPWIDRRIRLLVLLAAVLAIALGSLGQQQFTETRNEAAGLIFWSAAIICFTAGLWLAGRSLRLRSTPAPRAPAERRIPLVQRRHAAKGLSFFLVPVMAALLAFQIAKRAVYYSAEPVGPKDCYPRVSPIDSNKQTTIVVPSTSSGLVFVQRGGTTNDASCLNRTPVYGIVRVQNEEDANKAIVFARANGLKVSIAGVKHSMGGQAFSKDALVLDMTAFNKMSVDENDETLTVQSGATWHDIQTFLNPKGLAVKAMQSADIFSVGGSISVDAHGMDPQFGSISSTIRSIRIMLSDGSIRELSPTNDSELFRSVIGGYGLFGIILEAKIEVTTNDVYESTRDVVDTRDLLGVLENTINDRTYHLVYAHLSTAPNTFLNEGIIYKFRKTSQTIAPRTSLTENSSDKLRRFVFNLGKTNAIGQQIKWWAEKYLEPRFENCSVSRAVALGQPEACMVSRNQAMHDSGNFLGNNLKNDTDILQEYFVPRSKLPEFIEGAKSILRDNRAKLMNASIRIANAEHITLSYAPEDMFAIVLYLNQKIGEQENQRMSKTNGELINLAIRSGGTFYLTYQTYYSKQQLAEAYPNIDEFFRLKLKYDPGSLFSNSFYEKYKGN